MAKLQYLYNESGGLRAQVRPLSYKHRHCKNQAKKKSSKDNLRPIQLIPFACTPHSGRQTEQIN